MRPRIPLERGREGDLSLGWSSQVSALTCVALFFFLVGSVAWLSGAKRQQELASKPKENGAPIAQGGNALEALRSDFLDSFSKSLDAAGVDHALDADQGIVRLGPAAVSFRVGQAWLVGRPLEQIDRVGELLSRATACLSKGEGAYQAPSVFSESAGMQACTPEGELATVEFACKPGWKSLAFEAVLVEGHADARPYSAKGRAFKDNLNLSSARGETVMRRLYACNPDLASFTNPRGLPALGVAAHSTQRPAAREDPLGEGNRRVELRFLLASQGKGSATGATAATGSGAASGAGAKAKAASASTGVSLPAKTAPPGAGLADPVKPPAPAASTVPGSETDLDDDGEPAPGDDATLPRAE